MAMLVDRRPRTEAEEIRRGFERCKSALRRQVLAETLRVFQQANPADRFYQLARYDHDWWAAKADGSPARLVSCREA